MTKNLCTFVERRAHSNNQPRLKFRRLKPLQTIPGYYKIFDVYCPLKIRDWFGSCNQLRGLRFLNYMIKYYLGGNGAPCFWYCSNRDSNTLCRHQQHRQILVSTCSRHCFQRFLRSYSCQ